MKVEKLRRYCVDWVEMGTIYFRYYKTEGAAKNYALHLIHDIGIPKHLVKNCVTPYRKWVLPLLNLVNF